LAVVRTGEYRFGPRIIPASIAASARSRSPTSFWKYVHGGFGGFEQSYLRTQDLPISWSYCEPHGSPVAFESPSSRRRERRVGGEQLTEHQRAEGILSRDTTRMRRVAPSRSSGLRSFRREMEIT
jgi:hypothetical protein